MATPLINALRVQGGTFYTFISSANDISKTFSDDDARFVFSKFVLLDLPDVATPASGRNQNYIVWESIGARANSVLPNSAIPASELSSDNNINLAQSFQNYVLNFEQLILDGRNDQNIPYNSKEKYTVSERLFWKWLANINAIRFRSANAAESTPSGRFVEENQTDDYKRVVKYIGDIDVVNNVSKHGQTYSEIYLNVPSSHGNTPVVLFKTLQDTNYLPGRKWNNNNSSYVDGRNSSSTHPSGLSLTPYWDDTSTKSYWSYGPNFGDITNVSTNVSTTSSPKPVLLSRMDGIVLDMDNNSYAPIAKDPKISLLSEFNTVSAAGDFSFNVALVYYDMYDVSNTANRARNLYGVLILDNFDNNATNSFIKRFDKYKSNNVTKMNGNGYGLKLNIKFDTSADNVGIETVINEYNTYSMALFSEATSKMQEAANLFINQKVELTDIKTRLDDLENYFYTQDDLKSLSQRITDIEMKINNAMMSFNSTSTLLDLINKNSDNINSILSGKLSNSLSYNTDIISAGFGLILDKSVKNQVTLKNINQSIGNFMICKNSSTYLLTTTDNGMNLSSTTSNNILVLGQFNNYFKQKNQNPSSSGVEIFDDNLYITIDDSNVDWSNGQTVKIVFDNPINVNGLNIIFKTDAKNKIGQGAFEKIMAIIKPSQLLSNRPIIEIYCENEKLYTFGVDILR